MYDDGRGNQGIEEVDRNNEIEREEKYKMEVKLINLKQESKYLKNYL